jgi:hypothetical protein
VTPPPCIFCPTGAGTTADHIPPKSFFAQPRPGNLVTVPCCEPCRVRDQRHDETVRNLFASLNVTEGHPDVMREIAGNRNRAMQKQAHKAERLLALTKSVKFVTPAGIYVGNAPAFDLNIPEVDAFLERVCRGVLYDSLQRGYFEATFRWKRLPSKARNMIRFNTIGLPHKVVGTVFTYVVFPDHSIVGLLFYDGLAISGQFDPPAAIKPK